MRMCKSATFEGFKQFIGDSTFSVLRVKPGRPRVRYTAYIAHKVSIDGHETIIYSAGTSGSVGLHKNDGGMVSTPVSMGNPDGLAGGDLAAWEFCARSDNMKDRHTAFKEALSANDSESAVLSYVVKALLPSPIPYSVLDDVAKEMRKWAEESHSAR